MCLFLNIHINLDCISVWCYQKPKSFTKVKQIDSNDYYAIRVLDKHLNVWKII